MTDACAAAFPALRCVAMPRVQRRFLLGSRWTSLRPLDRSGGECHFEVLEIGRDELVMRAVLTRRDYRIAVAALDDVAAWATGWIST